jgi:hypothetical protein
MKIEGNNVILIIKVVVIRILNYNMNRIVHFNSMNIASMFFLLICVFCTAQPFDPIPIPRAANFRGHNFPRQLFITEERLERFTCISQIALEDYNSKNQVLSPNTSTMFIHSSASLFFLLISFGSLV